MTGLGGSTNQQKTPGTSHKSSRSGGSSRHDDNEAQAHSVSTKQREETKTPAKPVSSYVVSSQERAELEANPKLVVGTKPQQQKVRSAYGYDQNPGQDVNQQVDDRDNHEFNDEHNETQLQNPPQSSSTRPANKKPRLIINSDPFTPSPPESPSASPQHEPELDNNNNNDNDDDGDDEYTNTPPSRKKKTRTNKSSASKSKSKARIASAKNRKQNFPVASALSEASEADKMMFRMKGEGKSWKEITAEWTRMTGRKPGFSTLSVRFGKLQEKFARMGDMDVRPPFFSSLFPSFKITCSPPILLTLLHPFVVPPAPEIQVTTRERVQQTREVGPHCRDDHGGWRGCLHGPGFAHEVSQSG